MRTILLALSLLLIGVSLDAVAQQQRSGTPEGKGLSRDVQRFCRP